jgi:hypothetical protein
MIAGVATRADVRRIALKLPETEEAENHFAFSVRNKGKLKGFAWAPRSNASGARAGPGRAPS